MPDALDRLESWRQTFLASPESYDLTDEQVRQPVAAIVDELLETEGGAEALDAYIDAIADDSTSVPVTGA